MRLERFALECDILSAAMLAAGTTLADAAPGPYIGQLCGVLGWMQAVRDGIPADDRCADGSVMFSRERMRTTLPVHLEAARLIRNRLALGPQTPARAGTVEWLATHRMRLFAAAVLLALDAEALS